ncbi:MAG: 2-hydroxyacyl-CoA dehydratase family protein [Dehalococcoidia bacterium]|nr:2-hydroxyacyl-CoA dehydratase family protein [Dehalococcoidia bacterium]
MPESKGRMGYFCSLVPTEIIIAAGFKPVWVKGKAEMTATADARLYPNMCPYIKSLFADAVEDGEAEFDGLVFTRSCDGARRLYDAWKAYIPSKFHYMLEAPKNADDLAVTYYASQLRDFADRIGKASGSEITGPDLKKAIKEANKARGKMRDLYSRQKVSPLLVAGSELFSLGLELLHGDGDDAADSTSALQKKAAGSDVSAKGRKKIRIMICGNVMSRPDIFQMIEDTGAEVPVADLCTGLRSFERIVDEKGSDPFMSLAQAYLGAPRCSRTAAPAETYNRISDNVMRYAVNGVILTALKFCDQQLYDIPYLLKRLNEDGTPVLFVENDYVFTDRDRIKTRIEAFVEMLAS